MAVLPDYAGPQTIYREVALLFAALLTMYPLIGFVLREHILGHNEVSLLERVCPYTFMRGSTVHRPFSGSACGIIGGPDLWSGLCS